MTSSIGSGSGVRDWKKAIHRVRGSDRKNQIFSDIEKRLAVKSKVVYYSSEIILSSFHSKKISNCRDGCYAVLDAFGCCHCCSISVGDN